MSVWVTRSAPDNLRTARGLHALGRRPLMVPVLTTAAIAQPPLTGLPDAIIFTSIHALRHFTGHADILAVPVFTASGMVAAVAQELGYLTVTSTGDNDAALLGLLRHALPPGSRVLLLCGERTSHTLAAQLRAMAHHVESRQVYRPIGVQNAAIAHVADALPNIEAIVVHSRGGAERLVPMLRDAHWHGALWCISEQAALACNGLRGVTVKTAPRPCESALIDMIARFSPAPARRRAAAAQANADLLLAALTGLPAPGNDG